MKQQTRILFKVILCLLLAAGSYLWANASIDAIYAYRSPLDQNPPLPNPALASTPRGRVVIVLIDALRADTAASAEVMPVLNQLRAGGASAVMHSRPPSFSTPGYGVLLTGAWPELSGAPAFNLDYEDIFPIEQDTIFSAATRSNIQTALAGYHYFEKLLPEDIDQGFFTAGEDQAADEAVMAAALPWLNSRQYGLVLIHLDQVDYAGHNEGAPGSANWNAAASRADTLLGEIVDQMDFNLDTLIVLSDHGHVKVGQFGGHGGQDPDTLLEPFVLYGAHIRPGQYPDVQMIDVAPTLAAILGTSLPASAQGKPLTDMLYLSSAVGERLPDALLVQQRQLLLHYANAIGVPPNPTRLADAQTYTDYQTLLEGIQTTRKNNERGPRAILASILLSGTFWLVRPWRLKNRWGWLAASSAAAVFHLRYILEGRTYTYSSLGGASDLIQLGLTGAIPGLLIAWLVISWRQGWLKFSRPDAAEHTLDLTLATTLFVLPILAAHYAWDGLLATWILPDLGLQYIFMLGCIQILFTTLSGLTLSGVAALLARSREASTCLPS